MVRIIYNIFFYKSDADTGARATKTYQVNIPHLYTSLSSSPAAFPTSLLSYLTDVDLWSV